MAEKKTDIEKDDRVTIMIPFVEGEAPDITVGVNGVFTKIKKGYPVKVTKAVAEVIANSNQQMMEALQTQRKFENQQTDL